MQIESFCAASQRVKNMLAEIDEEIDAAYKGIYIDKDGKHVCLNFGVKYYVPIAECRDIIGMCKWIFHLKDKIWMTGPALSRFAKVMCEANGLGKARGMPWGDL